MTDKDFRWSHGANGLRSHFPQPGKERWLDHEDGVTSVSVCEECGYCVWLISD